MTDNHVYLLLSIMLINFSSLQCSKANPEKKYIIHNKNDLVIKKYDLKKFHDLRIKHYESIKLSEMNLVIDGNRDCLQIDSMIKRNISHLRMAFNKRLREKTGLDGAIGISFVVIGDGDVSYCNVIESTANDTILEKNIINIVKNWKMPIMANVKDTTKIYFPFLLRDNCGTGKIICRGNSMENISATK